MLSWDSRETNVGFLVNISKNVQGVNVLREDKSNGDLNPEMHTKTLTRD